MWKAAFAGAMLAAVVGTFAQAQGFEQGQNYELASMDTGRTSRTPVVTEGHIARLKATLRLTALQLQHWPAVEAALRSLVHRQGRDHSSDGMVRRAVAAATDANALRRVASAAGPLIGSLDEKQKQDGMRVIRSLGFAGLASAL